MKKTIISSVAALALIAGVGSASAQTMSVTELQAMIAQLTAQIAATSGTTTTTTTTTTMSSYVHPGVTLRVGSKGVAVTALQNALNNLGFSAGKADGVYGKGTAAAVKAFQMSKGLGADGVAGNNTHGALVVALSGTTTTPTTPGTSTGTLNGGAGSVEEYELISGISNEEVGEDSSDVKVYGMSIEADDSSDLSIKSMKLVFNEGTAASDFEDYADNVSIWYGSTKVAEIDADEFNDDNDWSKTISLEKDAVVEAEEIGKFYVAVSGVSNLDSNDIGDTWTLDVTSVRFMDAQGAVISEDPILAVRTFSFESFATANDVELKISLDNDDINDAHVIQVDATDDTDNVDLLSFTMEADGDSDVVIDSIPVNFDVTGATNVDDMASTVYLYADNKEIASENLGTGVGADETVVFDNLDLTIDAGKEVEFTVKATLLSVADALNAGDTISAELGETETDTADFDAEDESGENLLDADITGSADGDAHTVYATGFKFELVSTGASVQAAADATVNDIATYTIKYKLTAFGGDISIDKDSEEGGADAADQGVEYIITNGASNTSTDSVTSTAETNINDANAWTIEENESETFTLTVTASTVTADHFAKVYLESINWDDDITDASPDLYFTAGLGEDKTSTDEKFINFNA